MLARTANSGILLKINILYFFLFRDKSINFLWAQAKIWYNSYLIFYYFYYNQLYLICFYDFFIRFPKNGIHFRISSVLHNTFQASVRYVVH